MGRAVSPSRPASAVCPDPRGAGLNPERFDTVVIGGGQAGLATGYYLSRRGRDFIILEARHRLGESWRSRWDSLRLFTPARFSHLPGLPCPARDGRFHTKDEIADYLEAYGAHFKLPVRLGCRVSQLTLSNGRYLITAGGRHLIADHCVVATGAFTTPYVPGFARQLDPSITQVHSAGYRNPGQLRDGDVLVVGAANSGAEIALELAADRVTWLAGRDTGHVPFTLGNLAYRLMSRLSVDSWPGRRIAASRTRQGQPLIRVRPGALARAGVRRVPRVVAVRDGWPLLEGGGVVEVGNVVWCSGFVPDYRWIKLPVFGPDGRPVHHRGVIRAEPGLHFVGLPFQSALTSDLVGGVGADAKYIVDRIAP